MREEKRIEIQKNGPYRVFGGIPLKEMAPVHTFNGEPVAWHDLKEAKSVNPVYDLCRCGQSKNKPFCDSSHEANTFDGTETASQEPYRERAEAWTRNGEILADDGPLCIHAGFCGTRTTNVWDIFAESDDPKLQAQMGEMIANCPSGRLALYGADGFLVEPDLPMDIAVIPGGPLWVRGGIPIVQSDGTLQEPRNRMTLCRCGQSQNKPFCDGTHADIHFDER
jgi:CDGSH-type Zn-finger protein